MENTEEHEIAKWMINNNLKFESDRYNKVFASVAEKLKKD